MPPQTGDAIGGFHAGEAGLELGAPTGAPQHLAHPRPVQLGNEVSPTFQATDLDAPMTLTRRLTTPHGDNAVAGLPSQSGRWIEPQCERVVQVALITFDNHQIVAVLIVYLLGQGA